MGYNYLFSSVESDKVNESEQVVAQKTVSEEIVIEKLKLLNPVAKPAPIAKPKINPPKRVVTEKVVYDKPKKKKDVVVSSRDKYFFLNKFSWPDTIAKKMEMLVVKAPSVPIVFSMDNTTVGTYKSVEDFFLTGMVIPKGTTVDVWRTDYDGIRYFLIRKDSDLHWTFHKEKS